MTGSAPVVKSEVGMRLIDADAFDKMLIEAQTKCKKNGGNFRFGVLANIRANLALFPTVDCPEIIRCKNCRYYHGRNEGCGAMGFYPPSGDWFCAGGERR